MIPHVGSISFGQNCSHWSALLLLCWSLAQAQTGSPTVARAPSVNIVPFGRVLTWDADRNDGCRASRIEEFRAEDVFLETDLPRDRDGLWHVPASTDHLACVGVQWLNRRAITEASIVFADMPALPEVPALRLEAWFGESAWQGNWRPLTGDFRAQTSGFVFRPSPTTEPLQTRKIRWIFPASGTPLVRSLSVFTSSEWQQTTLRIEAEAPARKSRGTVAINNGEFISPAPDSVRSSSLAALTWHSDFSKPERLTVRYSLPDSLKSDPTVLQFGFPHCAFGVAVADVLTHGCVYVPGAGVYVCADTNTQSLADYKRSISGRKTILQQVRQLPDQTVEQAMLRTHHLAQREGPVLLSLACDNLKFVLERDGRLKFPATTNFAADWLPQACELQVHFIDGSGQLARTLDGGWLPAPVVSVAKAGVVCRQLTFVAPADERGDNPARPNRAPVCVLDFTLSNTQPVATAAALVLHAGETRKSFPFPNQPGKVFPLGNSGLNAILHVERNSTFVLNAGQAGLTVQGDLPAHSSGHLALYVADARVELESLPAPERLREEFEAYWRAVLAPAIQVQTPEPLLNDLIRSSQVRCLIDARSELEGARVAPWIAAMAYGPLESEANSVIRGMDLMGQADFARRTLDYFIHRYNTNGFLTTGYTTFGTAWHLWTLGQHYQLTRDRQWLTRVAPELKRVGQWIIRQTDKTKRPGAPESGLMPPGVLADWNAFAYHFALNAYYYAALMQLEALLDELHDPQAAFFRRGAADLRANILRAYHWTARQSPALPLRNGTWIPAYPSQVHSPGKLADFFPGQDAGRSWCYDVELGAHQLVPSGVLPPASVEVSRMLDHMEDVQFLADGWFDYPARFNEADWFDLGGFSKVQPYYTRNCEVYALRDDIKPFIRSYFNTLSAMLNPEVLTFWEHFNHSGAWDKTHETGYFLYQTRTMLLTERGDELWLAPFVTTNWLTAGKTLSISNAPTRFGPVSFKIQSRLGQECILARILPPPPSASAPNAIVLRLRHPQRQPIRSVRVNGRRHTAFSRKDETIRLKPGPSPFDLEVFY